MFVKYIHQINTYRKQEHFFGILLWVISHYLLCFRIVLHFKDGVIDTVKENINIFTFGKHKPNIITERNEVGSGWIVISH